MAHAHDKDADRPPLPAAVIMRTRASLEQIYAAACEADLVIAQFLALPCVQAARRNRRDLPASDLPQSRHSLLNVPPETWDTAIAAIPRRCQSGVVTSLLEAGEACVATAPQRAESIAAFVLRQVRCVRAIAFAPLLRRQLTGRALLVRARASIALRMHAEALPVIAAAHAALPKTGACRRYRIHAQLLRGQVLAAAGDHQEALQTFTACARFAIEHIDRPLLVEALAAIAVVLCVHSEFDLARPALALAARAARCDGRESTMRTLQSASTECVFLGYIPGLTDSETYQSAKVTY